MAVHDQRLLQERAEHEVVEVPVERVPWDDRKAAAGELRGQPAAQAPVALVGECVPRERPGRRKAEEPVAEEGAQGVRTAGSVWRAHDALHADPDPALESRHSRRGGVDHPVGLAGAMGPIQLAVHVVVPVDDEREVCAELAEDADCPVAWHDQVEGDGRHGDVVPTVPGVIREVRELHIPVGWPAHIRVVDHDACLERRGARRDATGDPLQEVDDGQKRPEPAGSQVVAEVLVVAELGRHGGGNLAFGAGCAGAPRPDGAAVGRCEHAPPVGDADRRGPAAVVLRKHLPAQRAVERIRPTQVHPQRRPRTVRRLGVELQTRTREPFRRSFAGEHDRRVDRLELAGAAMHEPDRVGLLERAPELRVALRNAGRDRGNDTGSGHARHLPVAEVWEAGHARFRISSGTQEFVCAARPGPAGANRANSA